MTFLGRKRLTKEMVPLKSLQFSWTDSSYTYQTVYILKMFTQPSTNACNEISMPYKFQENIGNMASSLHSLFNQLYMHKLTNSGSL